MHWETPNPTQDNKDPPLNGVEMRSRNLWFFSQEVFSKSSLSGISQIAESRTWTRRILWIALFASCILGFFYHATTYFSLYAAYPTTVDVRVDNKGVLEFPGITLCNNNKLRKSLYCAEYHCNSNDNMQEYEDYWRMNKSDRIRFGYTKERMILKCKLNGRMEMDEDQCYKHFRLFHNAEHGNCYTFNAQWNMPDHKVLYAYESDMWNKPTELLLDLDVQTEEYLDDHKTPSVLIYVHDPRFYPDFGSEAVKARAGHFYSTTTKLLPLPYQTNCTTYNAMPWAMRNKGTLTPKMCTQECSRSLQLKACKCVSSNLTLLFVLKMWRRIQQIIAALFAEYLASKLLRKTFEAAVDSSVWPRKKQVFTIDAWSNKNLTEIRKNLVRIKIYLRTMEITMYEHQPKYELVEVFSHLGGYLSLWLGFSVLAFCELLEMVSMVILRITDVKTTTGPHRVPRRHTRRNRVQNRTEHMAPSRSVNSIFREQ
ncbi:hypothetical protein JTE90_002764 [Oedothorax gibbosus]|uniref:Amiloride-sensitive sodium channel n=1 Tax=Oedothorax gibbosus TaxID=931172 RepID=A0AAV6UL64_9ARAC|nr:hypothetical protein JTE90_002764 [Oedothorax gibbosus]